MSNQHADAHELKQQGALEAARNPNSAVTSEDAERLIVQDTREAGGAAYTFDANASPAEKAAQARNHIPEGFHHERNPVVSDLATDMDTGSIAQYDLPAARDDSSVHDSMHTANGHPTEDPRWARDRTGWEPRFGEGDTKLDVQPSISQGDPKFDGGSSLLDHQTWLESKLDESWYGDWYYNAGVIIFACLSSYVVALLGGGLAWIFLIMATCGTYYRTSLRRVRRNFRDDITRELAKARLETDTESLEWINSFLVRFWPIFAPVLCDSIITSVDQVLSTSTPMFLDSLRLKTFVLGTKPPRLEHVKTYPKSEPDIVLMDWKFSFNPNDVADLTTRQVHDKINPKVALEIRVGKGFVSKGFDVLVEDMACSGLMQVKVKLQIPFPHVEKIEICFLERPTFDYVCKPLGGDMFGFDINIIPGLESFIQEQIHDNLAPILYKPNVFPIEIAKIMSGNAVDQAIGVLQVTLHGAQGLKNPDKFPGTPDPYIQLSVNDRAALAQSKTVHENSNPRFNETFNLIITSFQDNLTLHVYDYNEFRKDKDLGVATFALGQLEVEAVHDSLQLEVMGNGRARGVVEADIRFFPVLAEEKTDEHAPAMTSEWTTGIARFSVEQAKDLDGSKTMVGQLNPYAVLLLNGKEVHTSQILKRTNNPIFPSATKELLITNRGAAKLGLAIKDDRDLGTDPVIGTYQIKLDTMLELMAKDQEWYDLAGNRSGKVKMTLQWKPVAFTGAGPSSGGYRTPIGVMRLHFHNAKDLRNLETFRKSDPYIRVLLSGVQRARTVTHQNNLNPDFDEVLYIPMHSLQEKLTLEVMDAEGSGKDRPIGLVELNAADFIQKGDNGEFLAHDRKTIDAPLRASGKGATKGTLNFTASFFPILHVDEPSEAKDDLQPAENESLRRTSSAGDAINSVLSVSKSSLDAIRHSVEGEQHSDKVSHSLLSKIKLDSDGLQKYESGLLVFKLVDAEFGHSDCSVEVVMDDMYYPAFKSSKATSKTMTYNETGDAMIREMDFSRITIRIRRKGDKSGGNDDDQVYAKLTGQTLHVLQRHLYQSYPLVLRGDDGRENKINVYLRYLPVDMRLDQSESIANMGTLRCEVLDAADLPAADRNGYSDPYCKFLLNGVQVFKTQVQKKTLHPAWNEYFEVSIPSRTAAHFKVECWDWDLTNSDDYLGSAEASLTDLEPFTPKEVVLRLDGKSGTIRLRMIFKADYITRTRQGSTTFSGTFAIPGKVVGAPAKGVGKGAALVGGNIVRGASFVANGFRKRKTQYGNEIMDDDNGDNSNDETTNTPNQPSIYISKPVLSPATPYESTAALSTPLSPSQSTSIQAARMALAATPLRGEPGQAIFTVVSGSGFTGQNIRVFIKQQQGKGMKEVYKTKHAKATAEGKVQWDELEPFKVACSTDAVFTVHVKDIHTFGQDEDLGQGSLLVLGPPEQAVHCGKGTVLVKTEFRLLPATDGASSIYGGAKSEKNSLRKSFNARKARSSIDA